VFDDAHQIASPEAFQVFHDLLEGEEAFGSLLGMTSTSFDETQLSREIFNQIFRREVQLKTAQVKGPLDRMKDKVANRVGLEKVFLDKRERRFVRRMATLPEEDWPPMNDELKSFVRDKIDQMERGKELRIQNDVRKNSVPLSPFPKGGLHGDWIEAANEWLDDLVQLNERDWPWLKLSPKLMEELRRRKKALFEQEEFNFHMEKLTQSVLTRGILPKRNQSLKLAEFSQKLVFEDEYRWPFMNPRLKQALLERKSNIEYVLSGKKLVGGSEALYLQNLVNEILLQNESQWPPMGHLMRRSFQAAKTNRLKNDPLFHLELWVRKNRGSAEVRFPSFNESKLLHQWLTRTMEAPKSSWPKNISLEAKDFLNKLNRKIENK
jgi:hypothetical protein